MADSARHPESSDDMRAGPDREAAAGTPRWVKLSGIVGLLLVLLFAILLVTGGGGGHGPGRHTPSGDAGGDTPPSGARESGGARGHKPPAGRHAPR